MMEKEREVYGSDVRHSMDYHHLPFFGNEKSVEITFYSIFFSTI